MRLHLATLAALLAFQPAAAADSTAPSLLEFELRSLAEPEVHSLERYRGKPVVMVFFQPECTWCLKQVRAINALREQCEIEAIAVGVNGNRVALRKELHRLRPTFPAYQASPRLIDELGGDIATPMTLLGDANGGFVSWSRGFLPDQQLLELMRSSGQTDCQASL